MQLPGAVPRDPVQRRKRRARCTGREGQRSCLSPGPRGFRGRHRVETSGAAFEGSRRGAVCRRRTGDSGEVGLGIDSCAGRRGDLDGLCPAPGGLGGDHGLLVAGTVVVSPGGGAGPRRCTRNSAVEEGIWIRPGVGRSSDLGGLCPAPRRSRWRPVLGGFRPCRCSNRQRHNFLSTKTRCRSELGDLIRHWRAARSGWPAPNSRRSRFRHRSLVVVTVVEIAHRRAVPDRGTRDSEEKGAQGAGWRHELGRRPPYSRYLGG